jgi:cell division protein FtsL
MRKIKIALWVVVFGFLALLIMQNQEFFFSKTGFGLDFYYQKYQIPKVPNVILFLAVFFIGLLIAYILSLFGQFKVKKTLKNLNATIKSQMEVISDLKGEIEAKDNKIEQLKSQKPEPEPVQESAAPAEKAASVEVDPTPEEEENKVL